MEVNCGTQHRYGLYGSTDPFSMEVPTAAGYLSLAYRGLSEMPAAMTRFAASLQELDLSHNESAAAAPHL